MLIVSNILVPENTFPIKSPPLVSCSLEGGKYTLYDKTALATLG
jgi:hypothetical protein